MRGSKTNRVLYLVQLPPPVHGVSLTNQFVYLDAIINEGLARDLVRMQFSATVEGLRKLTLAKLLNVAVIAWKLFRHLLIRRPRFVYFSLMPVGAGFMRDLFYAMIVKLFRVNLVLHLNNRGIAERLAGRWKRSLYQMVFRNAVVIHVSPSLMRKEILEHGYFRPKGTFIVPNTTRTFHEFQKRESSGTLRLLFFSNLFPEKGLIYLIESLPACREQIRGIELHVYGGSRGPGVERIYHDRIRALGLDEQVFFHGPVADHEKEGIFGSHDLFVFPSVFQEECFPLVLLEAMQSAIPIIATSIGGIPDMLEHGKEAWLITPGDPEKLAGAIIHLSRDPGLCTAIGKRARERFSREFSMEHFQGRMREVFESCLAQKK